MPRLHPILLAAALTAASCASPPPPEPASPAPRFSAERAWGHLEAIVGMGPRIPGSEGSKAARAYIRSHLDSLGVPVLEQTYVVEGGEDEEPLKLTHLTGVIEGEASGVLVLAAPYDTPRFDDFDFVGANDGGSGAALLLELARALKEQPLPYTVWLTFADGDAAPADGGPKDGGLGSRLWVDQLADRGVLSSLRLVLYFNRVADADLRIGRDLRSHKISRFRIFAAARSLGHGAAFPRGLGFEHVPGGHLAFIGAGMRRAVVVGDPVYGGEEAPGLYWHSEEDVLEHCSPESLGIVGEVTLASLDDISAMLLKVDRFARRRGGVEEPPSPVGEVEDDGAAEQSEAVVEEAEAVGGQDEATVPPEGGVDATPEPSEPPAAASQEAPPATE